MNWMVRKEFFSKLIKFFLQFDFFYGRLILAKDMRMCRNGRRSRLKICRGQPREGSSPSIRIIYKSLKTLILQCFETFSFCTKLALFDNWNILEVYLEEKEGHVLNDFLKSAYEFGFIDAESVYFKDIREKYGMNVPDEYFFIDYDCYKVDFSVIDMKELRYKMHMAKSIRTIKNIAIFFLTLQIVSIILSILFGVL